MQWNAHGCELKDYLSNQQQKIDIICIQETWLKANLNFKINNYSVLRKDRSDGRGGIGIFIKDSFCYTNKTDDQIKDIEYLHAEIHYNKSKLNVINIYNPPSNKSKQNHLFKNFFL